MDVDDGDQLRAPCHQMMSVDQGREAASDDKEFPAHRTQVIYRKCAASFTPRRNDVVGLSAAGKRHLSRHLPISHRHKLTCRNLHVPAKGPVMTSVL